MTSSIQYRFAKTESGSAIPIDSLRPETRHAYGPLYCLGCKRPMIASLGTKVTHHFKHKHEPALGSCGLETYLHNLTKMRVYEIFKAAMERGEPIRLYRPNAGGKRVLSKGSYMTWDRMKTHFKGVSENEGPGDHFPRPGVVFECLQDISHNLLDGCTGITFEKAHDTLIPDVGILRDGKPSVFIEIAVTHESEPQKISSGHPIVEMKIRSERDAEDLFESLENGFIDSGDDRVTIHNFPNLIEESKEGPPEGLTEIPKAPKKEITPKEERENYHFSLGSNGVIMPTIDGMNPVILSISEFDSPLVATDAYAQNCLYEESRWVKSCLLCKRHAFARKVNIFTKKYFGDPIFCLHKKKTCRNTEAAKCSSYYPYKKFEDLRAHRIRLASREGYRYCETMIPPEGGWSFLPPEEPVNEQKVVEK